MEDVASLFTEHLVPHWPFFAMAMILGTIVQFMKRVVWMPRSTLNKYWKFCYITMGAHAPVMGFIAGLVGFPASPGVDSILGRALYHCLAGIMSAYVVAAWKHFAASRGLKLDE